MIRWAVIAPLRSGQCLGQSESGVTRDIRVAKPTQLSNDERLWPHAEPLAPVYANLAVKASFGYRCAAYEYRIVAEGLVDFSLHYKLTWDHAAGVRPCGSRRLFRPLEWQSLSADDI
jgi:hypothetical protein